MAGSTFGNIFKMTTWGESHGEGLGVVIDGVPAGITVDTGFIQAMMDRRKPGNSKFSTPRSEADEIHILSGVFEDKTTGAPISMMVRNTSQRSKDYSEIASYYRPGHADYCFDEKYGFRDYRGGGRSSGRETLSRVAAGAVAKLFLKEQGININAYTRAIGPVSIDEAAFDQAEVFDNELCMPDKAAYEKAVEYLKECMANGDSAGGIIECVIDGVMPGLGEPVFDKLDAMLAHAIFSIGAVKGFEIGEGFNAASLQGSENNDEFCMKEGKVDKRTNHSGGILGGISDGSPIIFRAAVKPTPSISKMQRTVNKNGEEIEISVKGRHDPVIVPRAVVVVEAMAAMVIADAVLMNRCSKI